MFLSTTLAAETAATFTRPDIQWSSDRLISNVPFAALTFDNLDSDFSNAWHVATKVC